MYTEVFKVMDTFEASNSSVSCWTPTGDLANIIWSQSTTKRIGDHENKDFIAIVQSLSVSQSPIGLGLSSASIDIQSYQAMTKIASLLCFYPKNPKARKHIRMRRL